MKNLIFIANLLTQRNIGMIAIISWIISEYFQSF